MWMRKGLRYVFMAEAGNEENGGAGGSGAEGDAGAGADSGAAAEGQAGASGAGDNGGSSADAAGAAAAGEKNALEAGAAPAPQIPEKYQVKKEDGTLDLEASSLKLAEAYGNLEKRIGTGDLPPKTADDYAIAVPDALKEFWKPESDEIMKDFKAEAHAKGLTQGQFDFVIGRYFQIAPQLVNGAQALSADDCTTQLRSEWKTDEQYKAEVGKAYKAAVGYGGNDAEGIIKDHGNDPRIIRLLARVGAEMGEDSAINTGDQTNGGSDAIGSLMSSAAYNDPKHPDHARVSAQVQKHYEKRAAASERAGGAAIL